MALLIIAAVAVLAPHFGLGARVKYQKDGALGKPGALADDFQLPDHIARLAAVGKDLDDFVQNAEKNRIPFEEGSSLLMTQIAQPRVVSQSVYCPEAWQDRMATTAEFAGGGAFGKVYVARLLCSNSTLAIKVQKRTSDSDAEEKLMIRMSHPNVVKAFDSTTDRGRRTTYLLMESCSGGELSGADGLPEPVKARLFYEALSGLQYMHSQNLVHSDIKPENVMLSQKCSSFDWGACHSKVADFGLTCSVKASGDCKGIAGTPLYMAPGLIRTGVRSKPDDLWSMGIMLHKMIKGVHPRFTKGARTVDALLRSISDLARKGSRYTAKDSSAKEQLLAGLLVAQDSRRMSIDEAVEMARAWAGSAAAPTPSSTLPGCWTQCAKKRCGRRASCVSTAPDSVGCLGEDSLGVSPTDRPGQIVEENDDRLVELTIRRGFTGKLGFTVQPGRDKVIKVTRPGLAYAAGLRVGDRIVEIQHMPFLSRGADMIRQIIRADPVVTLGIYRGFYK